MTCLTGGLLVLLGVPWVNKMNGVPYCYRKMLLSQLSFINQININDLTGHFFVFLFLVGVTRFKVDEGKMDSAPAQL